MLRHGTLGDGLLGNAVGRTAYAIRYRIVDNRPLSAVLGIVAEKLRGV